MTSKKGPIEIRVIRKCEELHFMRTLQYRSEFFLISECSRTRGHNSLISITHYLRSLCSFADFGGGSIEVLSSLAF